MLELSPAQIRDLSEAYHRHRKGQTCGGRLRTGRFLREKGLLQNRIFLGHAQKSGKWYVITDEGIQLASAIE